MCIVFLPINGVIITFINRRYFLSQLTFNVSVTLIFHLYSLIYSYVLPPSHRLSLLHSYSLRPSSFIFISSHHFYIFLLSLKLYLLHTSPFLSLIYSLLLSSFSDFQIHLTLLHSSYSLIISYCLSLSHKLTRSRSYEELQIVCLSLCSWYLN